MTGAFGDPLLGAAYRGPTQRVRAISEGWVAKNGYCLRCDSDRLNPTPPNTRSCDFVCSKCRHAYELKSKCGVFGNSILDGAYSAMLRTIRDARTPTFLLMEYSALWSIHSLKAIHHSLVTEAAIRPRKPLSQDARRAGWIGCNIVLSSIAVEGQIEIIAQGVMHPKLKVRETFARIDSLSMLPQSERTWAATVLRMVGQLPSDRFSLGDLYSFERELHRLFPKNKHLKPKIRQQLQFLRDAGLIIFHGGGIYERVSMG